jgi:hypothetical protein
MKALRISATLQEAVAQHSWAKVIQIICSLPPKQGLIHQRQVVLAMAHLEKKQPRLAMKVIAKAMLVKPNCPMVYWVIGNAMQQGKSHYEAIHAYITVVSLVRSATPSLCCVKNKARAKGLVADSMLHSSFSYRALGQLAEADALFERHLTFRGPGCNCIYRLQELPDSIGELKAFRTVA